MSQPIWKLIAQLGDKNPIENGGLFVYEDTTGVYVEQAELLEVDPAGTCLVSVILLERCTLTNGILSDNKFHPDFPAWFATPESERATRPQDTTYLSNVAKQAGQTVEALIELLCSADARQRAVAYRAIGDFHGFANFDETPLTLTQAEARERYKL